MVGTGDVTEGFGLGWSEIEPFGTGVYGLGYSEFADALLCTLTCSHFVTRPRCDVVRSYFGMFDDPRNAGQKAAYLQGGDTPEDSM